MNIFFDSNYASQSSMPSTATFTQITANNIIIPGSTPGDILTINANKEVSGLAIGPAKYLIQSSGTSPQWTNSIDINTVKSTSYIIPGTSHGDLFTVDNFNTLEAVSLGTAGSLLMSQGNQYQWQSFTDGRLNVEGGIPKTEIAQTLLNQSINIPTVNAGLFQFTPAYIAGKKYKITISGKIICSDPCLFTLSIAASGVATFNYNFSGDISRTIIYTSPYTGNLITSFNGYNTIATNGLIYEFGMIVEAFY